MYEIKTEYVYENFSSNKEMFSFLVDDNSEHKKAKGVNRNVIAKTSHNEYKDVLFNNK